METPLTILYTYGLRGDLDLLPRMYNFIRQLKAHYREDVVQVCADDPAQPVGRVLLLDLGESCAPDVWHCQVSDGRSTLVVLDGMGYDAARVPDASIQRKLGDTVRLTLIDAQTPLEIEETVLLTAETAPSAPPNRLQVVLSPADATTLDGNRLTLQAAAGGQIGVAQLTRIIGRWALTTHEVHDLPVRILPDPTITASVEFVTSEARYTQKRRST